LNYFHKDVYDLDFFSETFRILKKKDDTQYGEYLARKIKKRMFDHL